MEFADRLFLYNNMALTYSQLKTNKEALEEKKFNISIESRIQEPGVRITGKIIKLRILLDHVILCHARAIRSHAVAEFGF